MRVRASQSLPSVFLVRIRVARSGVLNVYSGTRYISASSSFAMPTLTAERTSRNTWHVEMNDIAYVLTSSHGCTGHMFVVDCGARNANGSYTWKADDSAYVVYRESSEPIARTIQLVVPGFDDRSNPEKRATCRRRRNGINAAADGALACPPPPSLALVRTCAARDAGCSV